jgi:anti-anti-sigma factor
MNLSVTEEGRDRVRVTLTGMLDLDGVQAIDTPFQKILQGPQTFVVVDMSAVDYVASMGMAMFVEANNALRSRSGIMVMVDPQEPVEKVLRSFNIDKLIPIAHGEKEVEKIERSECNTR